MKSLRSILAALVGAVVLCGAVTAARADTVNYKIIYPGGPVSLERAGRPNSLDGPGGAKKVIVTLASAAPNRGGPRNELLSLSSVVVRWAEPRTCGFPTATVTGASQFTVEWPSACMNAGAFIYVQATSSGTQSGSTGSWKDAGGAEVSPATIIISNASPVPAVGPWNGGALVALLVAGGWLAARRRARAVAA